MNHEIVNLLSAKVSTPASSEELSLGGEVIAFAIIERPFVNIAVSTTLVDFLINVQIRSNYVFNPKLWDAFSNSLDTGTLDLNSVVEGRRTIYKVAKKIATSKYNPTIQV